MVYDRMERIQTLSYPRYFNEPLWAFLKGSETQWALFCPNKCEPFGAQMIFIELCWDIISPFEQNELFWTPLNLFQPIKAQWVLLSPLGWFRDWCTNVKSCTLCMTSNFVIPGTFFKLKASAGLRIRTRFLCFFFCTISIRLLFELSPLLRLTLSRDSHFS